MVIACACCACLPLRVVAQQQTTWEIYSSEGGKGAVEYDFNTGRVVATGGVVVVYGNAVLSADKISGHEPSGEIIAEGKVRIQQEDMIWAGDQLKYNFKTHQIVAEQFRAGKAPVFVSGLGVTADVSNRVYTATNAMVTADDVERPLLKIRASYVKIIPGDKVVARNATVFAGQVPVFYFPYYSRSLSGSGNHFSFLPGYRSRFGPFLLTTYDWVLNNQVDGAWHFDWRQKRGVGLGPDVNLHLGRWGEASLGGYYARDEQPEVDRLFGQQAPADRKRVWLDYQAHPATNLSFRSQIRYQGDPGIVREFFEGEYRNDPHPNTYFEVNKFWDNFSLDLMAQPRVNDFLDTVERLPDLRLTGFRQQLGESPFYYESESSVGWYRRLFPDLEDVPEPDYSAARADTYHQVVLPQTYFGWLNITPRVGGRFTYYSEADGPDTQTQEQYRGVFNTGAEASFRASRTWPGYQNKFFQMDGARHIIQPSVNYVYVPDPDHSLRELPQFDYEMPSLRMLPLEFTDYNAIDSIDTENAFRLGLRNKLQTKRGGQSINLLSSDLYTDWRVNPRADQTTFADVYSDTVLRPWSWVTLESLTRYDTDSGQFRFSYHSLTLEPSDQWNWTIGQFYLKEDLSGSRYALGPGNNLYLSSIFFRLNENWGFRATHHFEARTGEMEEQTYTVYRDLRSWTAALTLRWRELRSGQEDFTIGFAFSLKAHPRYELGRDIRRPYALLGG